MENENTQKEKQEAEVPTSSRPGLRTYAKDFGASISGERGDIIRRAIRETEAKEAEKKAQSLSSKQNTVLLLGSILAVVVGVGLITYVTMMSGTKTIAPSKNNQVQSIVFADASIELTLSDLTKEELFAQFTKVRTAASIADSVTNVFFTDIRDNVKYLVGARTVLSLFTVHMPELVSETLENAVMLGIYTTSDDSLPFLILKTNAYNEAFAGFREWESRLFDDMYRLFGVSLSGKNNALFSATFQDGTLENKDVRVLKNTANEIALLYAFADEQTIVIATDARAFKEILSRLTSQKVEQAR
ncbi:MAG: hypothetical protein MUD00_00480 [Candidatus Pacebacteria bacterium]|jgi:Arc/MetJ-type ribon-helix-helix transcriptional regulator|nr:hypothetical protein [Candidatus Paceibacterota bacterium]